MNEDEKKNLIQGERVELAEQIEVTRYIFNELSMFISQISKGGTTSAFNKTTM